MTELELKYQWLDFVADHVESGWKASALSICHVKLERQGVVIHVYRVGRDHINVCVIENDKYVATVDLQTYEQLIDFVLKHRKD